MKKIDLGVVVTTLIIVTISCSLAFFAARIVGKPKDINLVAKNVAITFTDTSSIADETISPGWNNVKSFTITNNSKEDFNYNILLKGLVNTFESINTLQYKITSDTGYNMDNYLNIVKTENSKDVVLAYDVVIPKGSKQTYQVEFKYISIDEDQSSDMGKRLGGTLAIEESTGKPKIYDKLLSDNPTIKTRIDFSTVFTEANTGTLYKSTESISGGESTNVYYFAGDARNNWVRFGEWQEDIYLFKTTKTTSAGSIEGMYTQTLEECNNLNLGSCNKIVIASKGDPIYWRIIRTNSDGSIRLLYSGAKPDTEVGFIDNTCWYKNSKGECLTNSENYLYYTFDDSESEIKKSVEKWYSTNLINYDNYISKNAIYCDDKDYKIFEISVIKDFNSVIRVSGLSGHNPTTWDAIYNGKILPSFNCSSIESQYTSKLSDFGNKQLNYPIGLITADEISFIGGRFGEINTSSWYYKNSVNGPIIKDNPWWTMSSATWNSTSSYSMALYLNGLLYSPDVQEKKGIRPVISIKGENLWKSGDGSSSNPYEIVTE